MTTEFYDIAPGAIVAICLPWSHSSSGCVEWRLDSWTLPDDAGQCLPILDDGHAGSDDVDAVRDRGVCCASFGRCGVRGLGNLMEQSMIDDEQVYREMGGAASPEDIAKMERLLHAWAIAADELGEANDLRTVFLACVNAYPTRERTAQVLVGAALAVRELPFLALRIPYGIVGAPRRVIFIPST